MSGTTGIDKRALWQTKSFWAGLLMSLSAVVLAVFGDQEAVLPFKQIVMNLFGDPQIWAGIAVITGRDALRRI